MHPVSLLFHDVFVRQPGESGFRSASADRYKLSRQDFEAQLSGLLMASLAPRITVDDGGVSYFTIVADLLEACGWRGYCFVSTGFIGRPGFLSGAQIRELDARGHVIGSHSATHPTRFSALAPDRMRDEWTTSRRRLEDVLGHSVLTASVPGGYFSKTVARTAGDAGFELLFNSEPVRTARSTNGCTVIGRFTIRRGAPPDRACQLAQAAPWRRCGAWVSWNAKALVKPLLRSSYPRVADWLHGGVR